MRNLATEIGEFLRSGGYRSAKAAQETALFRRKVYFRGDGDVDKNRVLFGDFFGFEVHETKTGAFVRFVGPVRDERTALDGYRRVLLNCGFRIEEDADPERGAYRALYVSPRG